MNKSLSLFIDRIGLFLLHLKKSQESQFFKGNRLPYGISYEELQLAYPPPCLSDIKLHAHGRYHDCEIGTYSYQCETQSDHLDDFVGRGSYCIRANTDKPNHIVILHGWRMDSLDSVKKLLFNPLTEMGNNLYFVTLPYHFDRSSGALYSGEYMISANIDRTIDSVRQAVTEIRALIRWLKEKKGGKVTLIGISLGGFVANLTSVVDDQIDFLVSIMYANRLSHEVWNTRIGKYIKQDLENNGITYDELREYWRILEPDNWNPKVTKENILLLTGQYDQYIEKVDADWLWEAWEKPRRIIYPCGHAGLVFHRKQITRDVVQFVHDRMASNKQMG